MSVISHEEPRVYFEVDVQTKSADHSCVISIMLLIIDCRRSIKTKWTKDADIVSSNLNQLVILLFICYSVWWSFFFPLQKLGWKINHIAFVKILLQWCGTILLISTSSQNWRSFQILKQIKAKFCTGTKWL